MGVLKPETPRFGLEPGCRMHAASSPCEPLPAQPPGGQCSRGNCRGCGLGSVGFRDSRPKKRKSAPLHKLAQELESRAVEYRTWELLNHRSKPSQQGDQEHDKSYAPQERAPTKERVVVI